MTFSGTNNVRVGYSRWIGIMLFAFAMLLLTVTPAHAQDCTASGGVIDGFVNPVPP